MTDSRPDPVPSDQDTEGCLCVVASYADVASLVGSVTAGAAERLMTSPTLGDFVHLRFADLGPRRAERCSVAVRRITDELVRPRSGIGRTYFAVVVVDRSAAKVEQLLSDCADSPLFAALAVWVRGIASRDDRHPRPDSGAPAEIAVSPTGSWSQMDLIHRLRQYGDELLRHFAARQEPGLTQDELSALRTRYQEQAAQDREPDGATPPPDVLGLPSELPQPQPSRAEGPDEAGEAQRPDAAGELQVQGQPGPQECSPTPLSPAPVPPPSGRPVPSVPHPRPRRLLARRWRRDRLAAPEAAAHSGESRTDGLVYLLVTGESISDDRAAWKRSRSALLEVDAKITAVLEVSYRVRALQGDAEVLQGEPREAGQLTRRDVKRPVTDADFAGVLEEIRALVKRDRARAGASGAPLTHVAVMFFTPDPPLADTVAAEVFRDLAREASILWVVPKASAELIAPAFLEAPGVRVIVDHETVADEVAALLSSFPPGEEEEPVPQPGTRVHAIFAAARPVPGERNDQRQTADLHPTASAAAVLPDDQSA